MRRARSAEYADSVLALVKESLAGKGLEVKGARLASMGIIFADDRGFRVTDNDSVPAIELVNPPFFVDSTLAATPELEKKWRGLNRTLANYTRRKKDAAVSHAPAVAIASAYDAQALAIVRVVVWDVPIGKQLASFFDFSTPDVRKSTAFVGLTIVNGTDGLILWDDWQRQEKSLRLEGLRGVVAGFASRLP